MAVITPSQTASLTGVATLNQGFISNEIEDTYLSHLDLNGFCTIDNTLQGVAGDIRTIDVYGASGTAVDVAEGVGNTTSIAVALAPKRYQIKCAQAWFRYSDEALMRDPISVQTGIGHLGVAMFNKVNADIFTEMNSIADEGSGSTAIKHTLSSAAPDFNCFVDAVSLIDIKDAPGEDALDAQQRFLPQVFVKYVEAYARTGYVGTVAGVNLYYKQDAVDGTIIVATRRATTVFNKTGVDVENAARGGGQAGNANTRMNDIFARKYYIAALTDKTQICKVTLTGA